MDCNRGPPAQHCRKCVKNLQGQPRGTCNGEPKRCLMDLFHGIDGLEHSRGGAKKNCTAQSQKEDVGMGNRWVPLDFTHGLGGRTMQYPNGGLALGKGGRLSNLGDHNLIFAQHNIHSISVELGGMSGMGSPLEQGSPSPKFQTHLQDLDAEVRWLRGDIMEMKKMISMFGTFVQISNSEVRT